MTCRARRRTVPAIVWSSCALSLLVSPTNGQTTLLEVEVVDRGGNPIAGAQIRIQPDEMPIDLTTESHRTNAVGRVELPRPIYASARAVVVADGHQVTVVQVSELVKPVVLDKGRDVAFFLSDEGEPTEGRVEWSVTPKLKVIVPSNSKGRGVLNGLPAALVAVTARGAQGSVTQVLQPDDSFVTFQMPPSGTVEGRVLDDLRRPLAGAFALIIGTRAQAVRADANGDYKIGGLRAGGYALELSFPGRRTDTLQVTVHRGQIVRLPPVYLAEGTLVTAAFVDAGTGEPIRGPEVLRESNNPMGFSIRELMSPLPNHTGSENGRLLITDLPIGSHKLVLDTPPFARTSLPPVEIVSDTSAIDLGTIVVDRGVQCDVTIVDRSNAPIPNMTVRIDHGPGISPLYPVEELTGTDGTVTFDRLGKGRYRIRVGGDERPGGSTPLAEQWFTINDLTTELKHRIVVGGVTLDLRVYDIAGPVAQQPVAIFPANGDASVDGFVIQTPTRMINVPLVRAARGVTDFSGMSVLEDVPLGSVRVTVSFNGSSWSMPSHVTEHDHDKTVIIPSGLITIRPLDDGTGASVPARITWTGDSGLQSIGYVDGNGVVRLMGIAAESGTLSAQAPGYRPLAISYRRTSDVPVDVLLSRAPLTIVHCRILGLYGEPLRDASVELQDMTGTRRYVVSDAGGDAEFRDVPPGPSRLIVRRPPLASYVIANLQVRDGANDVGAVSLRSGHRVIIVADDRERRSNTQYRIRVTDERGFSIEDGFDAFSPQRIGGQGEASVGPVAPGRYVIELVSDGRTMRATAQVVSADVTITPK